jgi:MFS family permease
LANDELDIARQVERDYRHNFWVNLMDGALFWAGSSLIATNTVLPVYVSYFTDSKIVIGLLSVIGVAGWLLPQLFTANWVQRLPRKKVLPVNLGLFTERLPVMLMAPVALLSTRFPVLALVAFMLLVTWYTVGAGVVAVAWQDMIAKIIPSRRRGKFFGITNFLGTATGVVGASAAAWLLDRYGFPGGYVWCFALAAVLIALSWVFLSMAREPAQEPVEKHVSQREYWQRLPSVVRADRNFGRFLLSSAIIAFGGMGGGFLAVYAIQRWHLPDGQVGIFTASMLVGQAISNLIFGTLADRWGHKLVLELGTLLGALAVGIAAVAPNPAWFYVVFVLAGANTAAFLLSGLMIALEFSEPSLRPTYIGLNNTVRGIAASVAPLLGGWLATQLGYSFLFALACALAVAGLATLHWAVREPRHASSPAGS